MSECSHAPKAAPSATSNWRPLTNKSGVHPAALLPRRQQERRFIQRKKKGKWICCQHSESSRCKWECVGGHCLFSHPKHTLITDKEQRRAILISNRLQKEQGVRRPYIIKQLVIFTAAQKRGRARASARSLVIILFNNIHMRRPRQLIAIKENKERDTSTSFNRRSPRASLHRQYKIYFRVQKHPCVCSSTDAREKNLLHWFTRTLYAMLTNIEREKWDKKLKQICLWTFGTQY